MAIFYMDVNIKSRGKGQSMGAVSAYRSGEKIHSERDGMTHDYTKRSSLKAADYRAGEGNFANRTDVLHSEIMLPANAPLEFQDRATLCNAIDKAEKRKDSQLVREVVLGLQNELSQEENLEAVRDYVQRNFVDKGMIADFSVHSGHIHDRQDETYPFKDLAIRKENPHVHILLTMRDVDERGFGRKNRDWNKPEYLREWREEWANTVNRKFAEKGLDERIDHRTLEAQGIEREPTKKMGQKAWKLETKGIKTKIGEENRGIIKRNLEKGLRIHAKKSAEIRRLENRAGEMSGRVAQARDEYGKAHFKRLFGVDVEGAGAEIERSKAQAGILRRELEQWEKWGLFERKKAADLAVEREWESYERARHRERDFGRYR